MQSSRADFRNRGLQNTISEVAELLCLPRRRLAEPSYENASLHACVAGSFTVIVRSAEVGATTLVPSVFDPGKSGTKNSHVCEALNRDVSRNARTNMATSAIPSALPKGQSRPAKNWF